MSNEERNKSIVRQMHFMYFRNGKMIGQVAVQDDMGLRQQLGAIAVPTYKP